MARPKFKFGQFVSSESISGIITGIHLRDTEETLYYLKDGSKVGESEVTAVFRPVVPRASKNLAPRAKKSKASTASAKAA